MSVPQKARLVVAVAVTASLFAGGMAAVWAADASAGCSWTDATGDASAGGGASDPDLDLTRLSFASGEDGSVLMTAKVKTLADTGPKGYPGDEFEFDFTLNDKSFVVGAVRTTASDGGDPETSAYVLVDGDDATADAPSLAPTFDPDSSTVQASISQDDLSTLAGDSADGAVLSGLGAVSYARTGDGSSQQADDASADEATWTVGSDSCDGQTASKPQPSSSEDPTADPTEDPNADPSEDPTAEPTPKRPTLEDQPTPGCTLFTDVSGDANPVPVAGASGTGNDPDVDLRAVTVKSLPESLVAFVKVETLADKPTSAAYKGHRFQVSFSFNGLTVSYRADAAGAAVGLLGGSVNPDLSATAAFDKSRNQVVFTISRAGLLKATRSAPADGKKLTAVTAKTQVLLQGQGAMSSAPPQAAPPTPMPMDQPVDADSATGTTSTQQAYTIGDNTCFYAEGAAPKATTSSRPRTTSTAPKPASLTVTAPGQVQYSDLAAVSVVLKSSGGKALSGKTVTATLGAGNPVAGRTDSSGKANLKVPATDAAGSRSLVVSFAGDTSGNAAKEVRKTVTVVVEGVRLSGTSSGTGSVRTYTATLTDDDSPTATPQTGQVLTFQYSGKTVTVKTDSSGRASVRVATGANIAVSYAGRTGYVAPAKIQSRA